MVKGKTTFKTAEQMGKEQRAISVSEFFEKNRHLLGFDNPAKALLTVVKEAVDNGLDACEEAGILPDISVRVKQLAAEDRIKITVQDNGPGIVKKQIPNIFAKLLYGSKFGRNAQGRGQQGIGISSALLYSQLTTGKATIIRSRVRGKKVNEFLLRIDTVKNEPQIISHQIFENSFPDHGTHVTMEIEAKYRKGARSVDEYIKQVALANPHAKLTYFSPSGKVSYKRITNKLPKLAKSIKAHPYGVELGVFERMAKGTRARSCAAFLSNDFCRVGIGTGKKICKLSKIRPSTRTQRLDHKELEKIWRNLQKTKLMNPPLNCLSPIGEKVLEEALKKDLKVEFSAAITRPPSVYRGNPFAVEVAVGYGGDLSSKDSAQIFRLANKVPLLYEQSSCAITKALKKIDWRHYNVDHQNRMPTGPIVILIHFYSTWIPYTSESKEAVDAYTEILKELKLALQDCLRKLKSFLAGRRRRFLEKQRQSLFEKYIPELSYALAKVSEEKKEKIEKGLNKILHKNKKNDMKNGNEEPMEGQPKAVNKHEERKPLKKKKPKKGLKRFFKR